jgi:hypothetical protein
MTVEFEITIKVRVEYEGSRGDALLSAMELGGDMADVIGDEFGIDEGDILGVEIQEVK